MVEVEVWQMAVDEKTRVPIVILRERGGTGKLPIWIGTNEASAIAMEMQGRELQRPMTHDLLATMLRALDAQVRRVEIASLKDTTYYARVIIQKGDELISVDARPSDSIALAVRMKAPILAAKDLLSHDLDDVLPDDASIEQRPEAHEVSDAEKAERLRRRIEDIDPEDFGRFSF